jgi:membrane protease YdiL (CAAX protease family)
VEKTTREGKKMKKDGRFAFLYNPVFRVITTWVWFLVGAALVILIILAVYGLDLATALEVLWEKRYLAAYIEIVSVGLLPLVFTLICKDDPTQYGLGRKGLAKSLLLSGLYVAGLFGFALLSRGQLMSGIEPPNFHLNFPWNLWYVALGVFAWGPLEVFFVTWLITNTDQIFKNENRTMSWGLIVTVVIFAMAHILTTQSIYNAFYTGWIFFVLGLIYKYTKNSIGPMIAWTVINGQIWFMVQILWS